MSDPNALDPDALAPYLEDHVPGFSGLEAIEKFKSGQSNPTYLLKARSGRYVLRAKPPGILLKSAHQVDREFRVMAALGRRRLPGAEGPASRGRRISNRPHVLCHGFCRWPHILGPGIAGNFRQFGACGHLRFR